MRLAASLELQGDVPCVLNDRSIFCRVSLRKVFLKVTPVTFEKKSLHKKSSSRSVERCTTFVGFKKRTKRNATSFSKKTVPSSFQTSLLLPLIHLPLAARCCPYCILDPRQAVRWRGHVAWQLSTQNRPQTKHDPLAAAQLIQ